MDQSDFDDLFETDHAAFSSSQSSLTNTAAQLTFCESDEEVTSDGDRPSSVLIPSDTVPGESDERDQLSENLGKYDANRNGQNLSKSANNVAPSCLRFSTAEVSPDTLKAPSQGQGHFTVIQCIEHLFQQIRDALHHEGDDIGLTLKVRTSTDDISHHAKTRRLSFPGRTAEEAWRFGEISTSASS